MKKKEQTKKEIHLILYAFILIAVLAVVSKVFSFYQMYDINKTNTATYEFTLEVSNSALAAKADIYKIHRDMKDIVLVNSEKELLKLIAEVNKSEENIYNYFMVMKKNISEKDGLKLQEETKKIFEKWKPIRDEVILLIKSNEVTKAVEVTKDMGAKYLLELEDSVDKLYSYAQNRAIYLKSSSDTNFKRLLIINFLTVLLLLCIFSFIVYYTIKRISKYIYKNEHLRDVLSVIRDVNQIIVREKNREKLVQECCDTLVTKDVFKSAWIVLYDSGRYFKHVYVTNKIKNSTQFKNAFKSDFVPKCTKRVDNASYYFVKDTNEYCLGCPLKDLYNGKSAFNLELKYKDRIFGHLTLRIDRRHIEYSDEIWLLKEVAGDMAYALNNIEVEQKIVDLKELYDNSINSLENLLFVKNKNFAYVTCNRAFEHFIGKSKSEIIGKDDYEILDKESADFFRSYDEKIFKEKTPKSNYEWVTYPDGKKVYLLTTKSPLLDSNKEIIGLVGNSIDVTREKKSEEALIESERRFKMLMKESPSVIEVYDLEGTQIEVNHAYELLWGFDAGTTLYKFNLFNSKEVENTGLLRYIKQAYKGENVDVPLYEFDSRGDTEAHGKGRVRILNTRIYPLKDSSGKVKNIVITHEDVTQREKSLLELEQKKRELETIVQEAPNPIMIHNEEGRVILINRAWEMLSGYSYSEIDTIEKWTKRAYGEKMPIAKESVNRLYKLDKRVDEGEYSIFTKNGDTLVWQFSSAPLGVIDGSRVIISSAMDITELKKKDELVISQSRHAAMGEMIGMIAHQWRQPLSIISMIANNILLDSALDTFNATKAEHYSKDIIEQTEYLSKTIDDFRNFFKHDKSMSKINLKDLLDKTFSIVKDSLKNNSIKIDIVCELDREINVYPRELMQVFVNIINNAKDALVLKKIENALIQVNVFEDNEYVNIKIYDNAGEIKEDILNKIFDPYFTTKDEKIGTGLGLYMSKIIVEGHLRGKIDVQNSKGGVSFIIKLPKEEIANGV